MELIPAACPTLDTPPPYLAHSMLLKAQDICGLSFLALRHDLVQFSKSYEV